MVLLRAHLLQPPVSTPQWTTSLLDERSADVPRLSVQFSPSALQNLVLLSSSAQPVECPTNLQRLPCQHLVVVQTSDQFASALASVCSGTPCACQLSYREFSGTEFSRSPIMSRKRTPWTWCKHLLVSILVSAQCRFLCRCPRRCRSCGKGERRRRTSCCRRCRGRLHSPFTLRSINLIVPTVSH